MKKWLKRLFCGHVFGWQENLNYVQQSLCHFKYKSRWKCKFCGKRVFLDREGIPGEVRA
jgi:hypothetical protein